MLAKNLQAAVAGQAAGGAYIEDVFSPYLWTGDSSNKTITNGIDLAGEGGMVWVKCRQTIDVANPPHVVFDTERGATKFIKTSSDGTQLTEVESLKSFTSTGFTLGGREEVNTNSYEYASWTFRKAPKFFDVVTYTGNGTAGRTVAHNLGSVPGAIWIKRIDGVFNWVCYHRSIGATASMGINSISAPTSSVNYFNNTEPTDSVFTLGSSSSGNASGGTYVAYLFAHDAGGFGDAGDENVISCGSYNGTGTSGNIITLGYEPQWLLIKRTTATDNWILVDTLRGMPLPGGYRFYPNIDEAENTAGNTPYPIASGFRLDTTAPDINASDNTYIYIAIRRGPMKTPTDATTVFSPTVYASTNVDNRYVATGVTMDTVWARTYNNTSTLGFVIADRLRSDYFIGTNSSAAQAVDGDSYDQVPSGLGNCMSMMNGYGCGNDATRMLNYSTYDEIAYSFKRAPGFYDVAIYTGNASTNYIEHNLGVVPELIIIKLLDGSGGWQVFYDMNSINYKNFNNIDISVSATDTYSTSGKLWAIPNSTYVYLGSNTNINNSGSLFISYMFASCPNVSKVGTYAGNGSSQTIDCGFSSSARFVLIKRTDGDGGSWYVWDSARGIVSGNDPHLRLNDSANQSSTDDDIDTVSTGFIVNETGGAQINTNGGTYLYLAIA